MTFHSCRMLLWGFQWLLINIRALRSMKIWVVLLSAEQMCKRWTLLNMHVMLLNNINWHLNFLHLVSSVIWRLTISTRWRHQSMIKLNKTWRWVECENLINCIFDFSPLFCAHNMPLAFPMHLTLYANIRDNSIDSIWNESNWVSRPPQNEVCGWMRRTSMSDVLCAAKLNDSNKH